MNVLLLDRDGVLTPEAPTYSPEMMTLLPGVADGLRKLSGCRLFVVSNQSAVGRGLDTEENVRACNAALSSLLREQGITVEDIVFCPHHPEDNCSCRKPRIGMWEALRMKHGLRAEKCVMIGNRAGDITFGKNIGCRTVFVTGRQGEDPTGADLVVKDLIALAKYFSHAE